MNTKRRIPRICAAGLLIAAGAASADDHDEGNAYKIAIHEVQAKIANIREFRAGMEAYADCLAENGSEDGYSVWRNVDGDRNTFHIVGRFDAWAEFDEGNEASETCWGDDEIRAGVFGNMTSWETSYAERMPAWSGDLAEDYTVVKLHNFRVAEGDDFRALVGEITGYMAEAEYEHQGDWFDVMSSGYWEADYFVVDHFANFAAMDEDRKGPDGVLREAVGDERTDQIWEDWGDTLEDMRGYWRQTLVMQPDMGYSPDDD